MEHAINPFEGKDIRKIWHNEEWFFSIIDVISILTDSKDPNQYWKKMKSRDPQIVSGVQIVPLSIGARKLLCANTESVFRLVMSVPSPKAEPLKMWLATLGKQAIDETENPELLTERQADLYRAKGYTEEWIARRVQTIETRKALTDEWKQRGVTENQEYGILTATIAKGTFGLTPTEHSQLKGLEKQNLRDHMTPIELIFTALGEEATRLIAEKDDAKGFNENHDSAVRGGSATGEARTNFEKRTGVKVVSTDNFLNLLNKKEKNDALEKGDKTE